MSNAINNYDDQTFYDQYSKLDTLIPENVPGRNLLISMLPADITGWTVLDLACGDGRFGRRILDKGVNSVCGYDLSKKMIEQAIKSSSNDSRLQFFVDDMETIELPKERYNLVHCQYGFHYIANLDRIIAQISNTLKFDGIFMFVVEHPIHTSNPWSKRELVEINGKLIYPVCNYFEEGQRIVTWIGSQVTKQHHTISSYVNSCIKNGLEIMEMIEWAPDIPKLRAKPYCTLR